MSEICFSICYQTHRGRYQGAEPKCRAFSLRRLLPHELIFRSWIEDGFNFDLLPNDPANEGSSTYIVDPIPLPPAAYTALADHIRLPSGDIPFMGPYTSQTFPPRSLPPTPLHWKEGYYFWTSRSRREIAHHLSTSLRLPTDTERIYHNQRAAWIEEIQRGNDPFLEPRTSTNSFVWAIAYDFLPDAIDRDWPATVLIPLNDPPPLGPELARLFEPVTGMCMQTYSDLSEFGARQLAVTRKIGTLWAEGKPLKVARRLGEGWTDGKVAKHAAGLGATLVKILKFIWSPPKRDG